MIGRDCWAEQKKNVITYFSGKYTGAVNTNYAYRYAICKALSLMTIVSGFFPNANFLADYRFNRFSILSCWTWPFRIFG